MSSEHSKQGLTECLYNDKFIILEIVIDHVLIQIDCLMKLKFQN